MVEASGRPALGTWGIAAGSIALVLGSGIATAPGKVAAALPGIPGLLAWLAGGLVALLGALVYGECAARRPADGGFFIYYREAFGPGVAWLAGASALLVALPASLAAITHILGDCIAALTTGVPGPRAGALALMLATGAAVGGVRIAVGAVHALSWGKLADYVALAASVLWAPQVGTAPTASASGGVMAALLAILFALDGWSNLSNAGGVAAAPARSWRWGAGLGLGSVVLLYVVLQHAAERAVGADALAQASLPLGAAAGAALGNAAGTALAAVIGLGCLSTLHALLWSTWRLAGAMGAPLPPQGQRTLGVASLAMPWFYYVFSSFSEVLSYYSFCAWAFYGLTALALLKLRQQDAAPGGWAARALPWAFFACCFLLTASLALQTPAAALPTLAGLGFGLLLARRVAARATQRPAEVPAAPRA